MIDEAQARLARITTGLAELDATADPKVTR